jgi:ketosteroid isomerase-like protein
MTNYHAAALDLEEQVIEHLVAENGSVAAVTHLRGTFVPTSTPVDLRAVDFFQVTGEGKVGRLCRYFDSCLLTGA